jgi:lipoate---protein ligase
MNPVRLLDLGNVSSVRSQTVYHAVAEAMTPDSPDTVILVSTTDPYVCVGYHQDLEREVDLERCRELELPVYRRQVGGGAVYLDSNQVFAQWVVHPDRIPGTIEERYARYIAPLVDTYRDFGIEAYLRPVNDIHVDGRKIGGTGAAQIGDALVLVGSLMFDFDRKTMSEVLKIPSEKMRDKVFESLNEYMVTIADLAEVDPTAVLDRYVANCSTAFGAELVPGALTPEELATADELDERFSSRSWLYEPRPTRSDTGVKINTDLRVVEGAHKAPGGLVRVTAQVHNGDIGDLALSGDFTLLPADAITDLESAGTGPLDDLETRFAQVYQSRDVEAPGLAPSDLAAAVAFAAGV